MKPESKYKGITLRVHLADGSTELFHQPDTALAHKMRAGLEPAQIFSKPRLVVAGEHFKSVYVSEHILRVDVIQLDEAHWQFPGGYSDMVELTESEFRQQARLDHPEKMARREQATTVGDLLVSFLKLHMVGGRNYFLMIEFPVKLPTENHSFLHFMLSKNALHLRLREGGYGIINLANLVGYTVYPGVAELPIDALIAERILP